MKYFIYILLVTLFSLNQAWSENPELTKEEKLQKALSDLKTKFAVKFVRIDDKNNTGVFKDTASLLKHLQATGESRCLMLYIYSNEQENIEQKIETNKKIVLNAASKTNIPLHGYAIKKELFDDIYDTIDLSLGGFMPLKKDEIKSSLSIWVSGKVLETSFLSKEGKRHQMDELKKAWKMMLDPLDLYIDPKHKKGTFNYEVLKFYEVRVALSERAVVYLEEKADKAREASIKAHGEADKAERALKILRQ